MNETEKTSLLDAIVRIDKLPASGRRLKLQVPNERLPEIGQYLKVSTIEYLRADLLVTGFKKGLRVSGTVEAGVTQPCVVTLTPVVQTINETLERVFLAGPDLNANASAGSETFIELSGDEIPDYFEGDQLDLSSSVLEVLGLAIELYPRLPGVEINADMAEDSPQELSPFAVLAARKTPDKQ
ncbi:hypothetical protein MNBD_ALPHA12-217 [hydrothermal vent metagenome]|uniref:COG1399 protein, clustered with ribosomal protein L32p n=1 Tax=hydrothermal vent metagenome TaxID=652676 RepID=A0A3B0UGD5_9ZZZZ